MKRQGGPLSRVRLILAGGTLLGALLAASLGIVERSKTNSDGGSTNPAPTPNQSPDGINGLADAGWAIGQVRQFTLDQSSLAKAGEETLVDLSLQGGLRATRVPSTAISGNSTRLVLELKPQVLSLKSSPESETELRSALEEHTIVDISERGLVSAIGFSSGESASPVQTLARGVLRAIAASLQMAKPGSPHEATWTAKERDMSGVYLASYERQGDSRVEKRKLRYEQPSTPVGTGAKLEVTESKSVLQLEPGNFTLAGLRQLSCDEGQQVTGGTLLPQMSARTQIRLELTRKHVASDDTLATLQRATSSVKLAKIDDRSLDSKAIVSQARLAGTSYGDLLDELQTNAEPSSITGSRARAYSQFVAQLRHQPDNVSDALTRIQAGDKLAGTLIDALGNAGTPEAQAALRTLVNDANQSVETKHQVVLALAMGEYPTAETTELLQELQTDEKLGRQAKFGLGTAAYHLRARGDARSQALVELLEEELAQASSLVTLIDYLKALGNAADPASLDAIAKYLAHENSSVRAAAVDALRRIPGGVADQYLAKALGKDAAPNVRQKAAESIAYRGASAVLVYALINCLTHEPERTVRLAAVRTALRWASQTPQLRDTLTIVAQSDRDKKIRELAASAT